MRNCRAKFGHDVVCCKDETHEMWSSDNLRRSRTTFVYIGMERLETNGALGLITRNRVMDGLYSFLSTGDKETQLDVTFCILYFSSNSCSTCFGQPCAHHQELTTA